MDALTKIKQVSKEDLHRFLQSDHRDFNVLTLSFKQIESTQRTFITLSKNSAKSFYLKDKSKPDKPQQTKPTPLTDCRKDTQNCHYFALFSSKEKRLHTIFKDKIEANFEGTTENRPLLFLTLTFNTTQENLYSFTTNWSQKDPCWEPLQNKLPWLTKWARTLDPKAEPLKVKILKTSPEIASNWHSASKVLSQFLRKVRHTFKPQHWKWVVIAELQKNGHWHFHFLSTPIVPYSHNCTLSKNFKSCWNCRAYISKLWPWGRVESRSTGRKTISQYLAKYLSKSFHLRNLYQQHGLQNKNKTYRFFKNLYEYETREAILINDSKYDQETGKYLAHNQHIFRRQNNTYYYRTNETLIGHSLKPLIIKRSYRLYYHSLNTQPILNLSRQTELRKQLAISKNTSSQLVVIDKAQDFQEYLITSLLLLSKKATFANLPLEQPKVPQNGSKCDQLDYNHFQKKPVLHLSFAKETAPLIKEFILNLDNQAQEFLDVEEKQHFSDARFSDPVNSRNAYLNHWNLIYHAPWQKEGGARM
ncbi:rolling circle replication-associated protein [endosymbiont GvMRE of Glomus versiforme]|uniref:rolling circle replication-associated protein n=1 Tax=endosymbiont GvMRE of Glomus versiforme TaxID=2039283 RepID=UPI000ECF7097|nr:hypothetical protein [endosymbiont GvMRE of Glomus versiforme]RHZ36683.1 hypothetical protein GvMRE_I2g574 [endosymbiont GvMRE of Glomus versiforme]